MSTHEQRQPALSTVRRAGPWVCHGGAGRAPWWRRFHVRGVLTAAVALGLAQSQAAPPKLPDEFPITMTFRSLDGLKVNSDEFAKRLDAQASFDWIHAVRPDEAVRVIENRWPDKILTLQEAYGGLSERDFANVWFGHLLYKPGTLITRAIGPSDTVIVVDDPRRIVKSERRLERMQQHNQLAVVIYALDESGKPDWNKAEHLVVESIDRNGITVKRGQWGSSPKTFAAGKAVVAAHMMFWTHQWQLNFSLDSPRGGDGNLTAAEWYARKVADRVIKSGATGVEFDVARWTWGYPQEHAMDANNDRVADYGYLDGINSFGLGGRVFFRELRKVLGPDRIIQADSNDAIYGIRGWDYLNGVQLESFPAANNFDRFSPSFLHLMMWSQNAGVLPRASYPFTKTPTTVFSIAHRAGGGKTDSRFRVGLAAAVLTGSPHPFASLRDIKFDPANARATGIERGREGFGVFIWDEYRGGTLDKWHWLGRPLGDPKQDLGDLGTNDLLAGATWRWRMDPGFAATPEGPSRIKVTGIPAGILPPEMWFGVRYEAAGNRLPRMEAGRQYTIVFDGQGDDQWQYRGQQFDHVPRMAAISGAAPVEGTNPPVSVLVDSRPRTYRITYTSDGKSVPSFGVGEQIGATELTNIRLLTGSADRWSREFENGIVLINMSTNEWKATLPPGKSYRRLKGTQAPEVNSGEALGDAVVVPPQDAVFLVKR